MDALTLFFSVVMVLGPVTGAITEVSGSAGAMKTAVLTILGVLVTIGLAWAIVKGLQK